MTNFGVKAVRANYTSCFRDRGSVLDGIIPADWQSEDSDGGTAWSTLALDYSISNVVTPDAPTEIAVKEASSTRLIRDHAASSAGLYVWIDDPDLPASGDALLYATQTAYPLARFTRHGVALGDPDVQVGDYGHVISVSFEDGDVIRVDPPHFGFPRIACVQLRTCTVVARIATSFDP